MQKNYQDPNFRIYGKYFQNVYYLLGIQLEFIRYLHTLKQILHIY